MLDLFISYINFFIAVVNYIIGKLTFQPPNPPGYIIEKTRNKKEIFFITENGKQYSYERKAFKDIEIKYIYLNHAKNFYYSFQKIISRYVLYIATEIVVISGILYSSVIN